MILTDLFESNQIHNRPKLDDVLGRCIELVHKNHAKDPKRYGKVAACIIDNKNRKVFGINLPGPDGTRRHAERVAIDAYHRKYGKILPGAIIVTTLSPCNRDMEERDGPSCQDLLLQAGIEKVYSGYMDPSQHSDHPFTEETTANDDLWQACKELSDSFVHDDLTEGTENNADGQQVLDYIHDTHHEPLTKQLQQAVLSHPRWELRSVPVSSLHIPDQEYDDEEQEPEADPYNRVQAIDPDHAGEYSANFVDRRPIVVDHEGWIIDGNHRAWAAAELLNKHDIKAWVPASQLNELGNAPADYKPNRQRSRSLFHATVDGQWVDVFFDRSEFNGTLHITFAVNGDYDAPEQPTSASKSTVKILSTVLNIVKKQLPEYMAKARPPAISFTSKQDNRTSLYRKYFVPVIQNILGAKWQHEEYPSMGMTVFHWKPVKKSGVTEAFDQPYDIRWSKGDHGDYDAYAELDDGTGLEIAFLDQQHNSWMVDFFRDNSTEITGDGDAYRVFATVLTAMREFIVKQQPAKLNFSAEKNDDPTGSRASLYDRMIQRYITGTGYTLTRQDHPDGATYTLTRTQQDVAEERLDELFQPGKQNWTWKIKADNEAIAKFTVGDRDYVWQAFSHFRDDKPHKWEIQFRVVKQSTDPEKLQVYGTTGTGNSAEVMSNAVDIMREFLQYYGDGVQQIAFDAKENSRIALYRKMIQRLLPNWNADEDYSSEYGLRFTLTRPKSMAEGSEEINWIKPNFDYEWDEIEFQAKQPQVPADVRNYMARHFPNKQAWMKSVQHGRPVVVSPDHGQKIRNYTDNKQDLLNALSPQSHDPQGPAKAKRVNALFDKGGPIEMPIILQTEKGLWLIGGKTRLGTANLLKGIPAKVWMIGGEQGMAEGSELPGDFKLMGRNLFLKNLARNLKQRYPNATVKLLNDRVTAYHNKGDDEALTVMGTEVMDSGYIGVGLDDAFTESFQGVLVPTIKQTTEQLLAANPGTRPALFLSTDNWNPDAWTHIADKLGYRLVADDESLDENFADGRHPEDKGDSKRYGVPTKASVSTLRKVAKQGGRKGQLAHWMANMKAGRAKARKK